MNEKKQPPEVKRPIPRWLWWALPPELRITEQPRSVDPDALRKEMTKRSDGRREVVARRPEDRGEELRTLAVLAIETWRLERRVEKLKTNTEMESRSMRPLESSVNKLKLMLEENGIEFRN